VAFVGHPATGAWVADPYNLGSSQPFVVVGATSLGAPSWAALVAVINQGRESAGQPTLNTASPTETQQALYSLGQSDYHVIASGTNGGYKAAPGYNLVTGLGTPVANVLVPDMVAGNYPATGRVAPISPDLNANRGWNGSAGGGTFNAFRGQGSGIRGQGTEISDVRDGAAFGLNPGLGASGSPGTGSWVGAGAKVGRQEAQASGQELVQTAQSVSDLVFADYDASGIGQDSDRDVWLGAYERSDDALDVAYRALTIDSEL
jgi:hypothetical protein